MVECAAFFAPTCAAFVATISLKVVGKWRARYYSRWNQQRAMVGDRLLAELFPLQPPVRCNVVQLIVIIYNFLSLILFSSISALCRFALLIMRK